MPQSNIRRYLRHGMLPQLRAFEAIARLGSGTRAAEELHIAQPTASVQIKKLSETVGLALFEQIGNRIHLTEAGERVYVGCNEVFRALWDMEQALAELRGSASGRLRLVIPRSAEYFAARLLDAFVERNPRVRAALQPCEPVAPAKHMHDSDEDLYMLVEPPDGRAMVAQAIVPNPLFVLASDDHPLAREKAIPFPRLASEPLLLREPGSGTRIAVLKLFARYGLVPRIGAEFGSDEAIREAILAGLGVSILPRYAPGLAPVLAKLVCLDVEGFPLENHWHLAYPVGRRVCAAARAFMDFARTEAKGVFRDCAHRTHVAAEA
jgi:LysR family transcriptional regulator, low CO2-responsive transcriptional regulator